MPRVVSLFCFYAALAAAQQGEPGKGVNFYSLEKEMALGRELAAEFQRTTTPFESPAVQAYVNDIGQRLAAQIGGPPFPYSFTLVADDPTLLHEVAAFPGGFLFVPSSLILAAKDEDEFAGMLAHAIAQVASRQGTRLATRAELANIASVPLVFVGGWAGYAIQQGSSTAIPMAMLQTWRKFELDSDRLAAAKMAEAGYDPAAIARYIDREQASYDEHSQRMFSLLPRREERVAAINGVISGLGLQAYPRHEGFPAIQEEVRRLTASSAKPKRAPSLVR